MADDTKNWQQSFAGLPLGEASGSHEAGEHKTHGLAGLPLSAIHSADELLHPAATSGHYSSTETSYYGFSIPDQALNGEIYLWFHPVLRVYSASVYIWTGLKPTSLSCEYANHHHYCPWPENDIADYVVPPTGMRIRVIEPLKTIEISYADEASGVSFSYVQQAIMPPAGRPGGFHFTQAMKTSGWLDLRGQRYAIDGYFSRDRSWGQERREDAMPLPPLTWTVGVFNDDFAFHLLAHDDPELSPEWVSAYPHVQAGAGLYWGYLWRDGILAPLTSARKHTTRGSDGVTPVRFAIEMADVEGRTVSVDGDVQARVPWQTWQNMNTYFCQTSQIYRLNRSEGQNWHCF
jgi:hypothetical protein